MIEENREIRAYWFKNIIDFLKQIASAEFQEKAWVRNEIHDCCTFVETICGLYDDSHFENFIDIYGKQIGLSDVQMSELDRIRKALNSYIDKHGCYVDPEFIVNDPEWHKIREMAGDVLSSLGIVKYLDPSKDIFKESLLYAIDDIKDSDSQIRFFLKERRSNVNPFQKLMDAFFKAAKTDEIIDNYQEYEISEEQSILLRQLYVVLLTYREKHRKEESLQNILDDPEWHKIQFLADKVLKKFSFSRC